MLKIATALHYVKTSLLKIIGSGMMLFLWTDKTQAEWTEFLADAEFSYTFQDNINHAVFDSETETDHLWNALISVGRAYQLTTNTRVLVNAYIDGSTHINFDKLDQLDVGVSLVARHKFGIGAFQPWVSGSVATGHQFSRSRLREGQITTAGFDFGKRLHDRLDISFSYRFDYRDSDYATAIEDNLLIANRAELGKSSSVFDLSGHSFGIQLNALLTQQWLITLAYHFRDGDIVSSNIPSLISRVNNIIDAVAIDDALHGWAYRAEAQTHRYSVDANYAFLKGHAAFNIGYEYIESHADPFTYRNNLLRVNLIYNF